jgi:hypothetical protein
LRLTEALRPARAGACRTVRSTHPRPFGAGDLSSVDDSTRLGSAQRRGRLTTMESLKLLDTAAPST